MINDPLGLHSGVYDTTRQKFKAFLIGQLICLFLVEDIGREDHLGDH